jgi:hypothetical protein
MDGSDPLVDGGVGGIISKNSNNVRCSASESKTGQPNASRRYARITVRWLLSIDQTGLSGVSPHDAPMFAIDVLSGETEPTTV